MITTVPVPRRRTLLAWLLTAGLGAAAAYAQEGGSGPVAPPQPPPAPPQGPSTQPPLPAPGPGGGTQGGGLRIGREQMWPAPSDADWQKPVLITWQRTWEDALAVAKETGRPILVCINMDGEIASEHYAGVRYRQPEIAALYEPYVCVIASVYRHNPRDFDEQGRRIPCPRFGGVTCGEHIGIEPTIFEKFCDGQRVAPRHIMVELDASPAGMREVYDVYYRNDTASVFADIQKGIAERPPAPAPKVRGDRPVVERVASRHVEDRVAVERAYAQGDAAQRQALLEAAGRHADAAQLDLLRLAVFGLDPALSKTARGALTQTKDANAAPLVAEALATPLDPGEREQLIATLKRLGEGNVLARWLAVVHQGLGGGAPAVDPAGWKDGKPPTYVPAYEAGELPFQLEEKARAARASPEDPALRLDLAEAALQLALEASTTYAVQPRRARLVERALLADARQAAAEAERLGAKGWRVDAAQTLAAYYAGDHAAAYARAPAAMASLPPGDGTWASMAVLKVFAESRWKEIKKAVKASLDFPPEWLTDVHAAYAVLLKHPLGTEDDVLWHHDLMDWLGAGAQSERILTQAFVRFADSPRLHARLRAHVLTTKGPRALEKTYETLLKDQGAPSLMLAFAGQASAAAGDSLRRMRRPDQALEAYARATSYWEQSLAADSTQREAADVAVSLLLAARARVLHQAGRDAEALAAILASFERAPQAAGTRDGLGITPGETAQMLYARLREGGKADEAARLEAAMRALDPELLRPDRE